MTKTRKRKVERHAARTKVDAKFLKEALFLPGEVKGITFDPIRGEAEIYLEGKGLPRVLEGDVVPQIDIWIEVKENPALPRLEYTSGWNP